MDINLLGEISKNCTINENKNSFGIYQLGMNGIFSDHIFFINGKRTNPCRSCINRNKNLFNECSFTEYCPGFIPIIKENGFLIDIHNLNLFLIHSGYSIKYNNESRTLYYPNNYASKLVSVHYII